MTNFAAYRWGECWGWSVLALALLTSCKYHEDTRRFTPRDSGGQDAISTGTNKEPQPVASAVPSPSPSAAPVLTGTPSRVLPFNPYQASGNALLPLAADLSAYLKDVSLTGLKAGANLTDGFVDLGASPVTGLKPASASDALFYRVNSYYHLRKLTQVVSDAGLLSSAFVPVAIDAQCAVGTRAINNAYFDPSARNICLGYAPQAGGAKLWGATDPDVGVHEMGHALTHAFSTDTIMASHPEAVTIDEGVADFWAYLVNRNTGIGRWYGAGIRSSYYPLSAYAGGVALRNVDQPRAYPSQLAGEPHEDSTLVSNVLYELSQLPALNAPGKMATFLKQLVSRFQIGLSIADFTDIIRDLAREQGFDAQATTILQARGLLRKDSLGAVALESVVVVDSRQLAGIQAGGNCDGMLNRGESAVVLVKLRNGGGTALGTVNATLTLAAPPNGVAIPFNGATYPRLLPGQNSVASLPGAHDVVISTASGQPKVTQYGTRLLSTAFVVTATPAASVQSYSFVLKLQGMNTVDSDPVSKDIPFTVTVGAAASVDNCTPAVEATLWP